MHYFLFLLLLFLLQLFSFSQLTEHYPLTASVMHWFRLCTRKLDNVAFSPVYTPATQDKVREEEEGKREKRWREREREEKERDWESETTILFTSLLCVVVAADGRSPVPGWSVCEVFGGGQPSTGSLAELWSTGSGDEANGGLCATVLPHSTNCSPVVRERVHSSQYTYVTCTCIIIM